MPVMKVKVIMTEEKLKDLQESLYKLSPHEDIKSQVMEAFAYIQNLESLAGVLLSDCKCVHEVKEDIVSSETVDYIESLLVEDKRTGEL